MADDSKWYAKRSDIYSIDPRTITIKEGYNPRIDFDLPELIASIRENGVLVPIRIRRTRDGVNILTDGERRYRAVMQLIDEGTPILSIPCLLEKATSDAEVLLNAVLANTGKPFTALEESDAYRRFLAWGWSVEQLAQRLGKSVSTVRNSLALLDAAPAVIEALQDGAISKSEAVAVVREARRTDEEQATLVERRQTAKREKKTAPREETAPEEKDANTLRRLVTTNGIDWAVTLLVQNTGAEVMIDAVHKAKNLLQAS